MVLFVQRGRAFASGVWARLSAWLFEHRSFGAILRFWVGVFRQWSTDRCPSQAASLAFQTILSVVPLAAVCLAVVRMTGNMEAESALIHFWAEEFLPASQTDIATKLNSWSENIQLESLGLVGLISTVVLAFVLINNVEKAVNHIWRSERKRSLTQKFVTFYATASLAPFFVAISLYQISLLGLNSSGVSFLSAAVVAFCVFFAANCFLPTTKVRILHAVVGAVVSGILFEGAKLIFSVYVHHVALARFSGIYGALAVFPIWLIWVYYSWLTFLFGIEITHALQHRKFIMYASRRNPMSLENEVFSQVHGHNAARVMVAIARQFHRQQPLCSRASLHKELALSDIALDRILRRLKTHRLVLELDGEPIRYIPSRPLQTIFLSDILLAFRRDAPSELSVEHSDKIDKVLRQIDSQTNESIRSISLHELAGET